jgi:Ala-tRNA(Pro) deacylase
MIIRKLKELLDGQNVKYTVLSHSVAFTAQEVAARAHVPGKEIAKCVVFWMDGTMALAVLPGSRMIDFTLLKKGTGARDVEIAGESEFSEAFPDCELGAMPPFGQLFHMKTFVDASLAEDKEIAFNAGTHRDLVRMRYIDYEQAVQPTVVRFSFVARPAA